MTNAPQTSKAYWQHEFRLTPEWQETLPSIWQLNQSFSLKIIQNIDTHSRYGERTFRLAHETLTTDDATTKKLSRPGNAASARKLVFLTPHFNSVTQLEAHAHQNSVSILQAHNASRGCAEFGDSNEVFGFN
ncbi:MAG: hypothetical protein U5M23_07865 [Marinagarivorans sp.]|nr:hypothetical protein [Marinagarivorans sp.]